MANTIPVIYSALYEYQLVRAMTFMPYLRDRSAELPYGDRLRAAIYDSAVNLFNMPTGTASSTTALITQALDHSSNLTKDIIVDQFKASHFNLPKDLSVESALPLMENAAYRHGLAHSLTMDDYAHSQMIKGLGSSQKLDNIKAGADYAYIDGYEETFMDELARAMASAYTKADRLKWPEAGRKAWLPAEFRQVFADYLIEKGVPDISVNQPAVVDGGVGPRFPWVGLDLHCRHRQQGHRGCHRCQRW